MLLLTFGWASVAVLAALGLRAVLRRDPAHPIAVIAPTALAWVAVIVTLAAHHG
ncbi:hypothetical protein [Peterkaempfera sp. SMS 1(5)a]|uniref:hypothetical protein n=1 Tax=Peterkaempfera podocarpi TaxID=3232308 RepID=UPI003672F50E